MAKEKFLIVAVPQMHDCFGRFSETANRASIDAGTMDQDDPYAWIEQSFEIVLIRHREATHICSFTPSAWQVFLGNEFVGQPNAAWNEDGDPDGLEGENGGSHGDYGTYRDTYDERFICDTFTIDTLADMDEPMRAPGKRGTDYAERYHDAIWRHAEDVAREMNCNGVNSQAPILDVYTFRQWERERLLKRRAQATRTPQGMFL